MVLSTGIPIWTWMSLITFTLILYKIRSQRKANQFFYLVALMWIYWSMIIMHQLMNSSTLSSHMFLPHIIQPTRITSNFKTLINNKFFNTLGPDSVSGNLTATVSDHLPQFVIIS